MSEKCNCLSLQICNFSLWLNSMGGHMIGSEICRCLISTGYQNCVLDRVDRYTGYIRYTSICLDTGIGDIDNLKIPIYRHFGILLPNTELRRYFKSNLLTITFRKQS